MDSSSVDFFSTLNRQRSTLIAPHRSLALAQMVRAVVDQQARSLTSVAIFFRNFAFFKVFNSNL
jgi:hypothetical protein